MVVDLHLSLHHCTVPAESHPRGTTPTPPTQLPVSPPQDAVVLELIKAQTGCIFSVPFVLYNVNTKKVSCSRACIVSVKERAEPCSWGDGLHWEAHVCGNANRNLVLGFAWKSSVSTAPVSSGWETGVLQSVACGCRDHSLFSWP